MIIKTIKNIGLMEIKDDITGNTVYGFDQIWYRTRWQRTAGCGPTTVANLLHYIARSDPGAKNDGSQDTRSAGLALMEEVWNYVTPSIQGVNTTKMLYEDTLDYAKAKGIELSYDVIDIPKRKKQRPPFPRVLDFIGHAMEQDSPVAFLNLHHGKEKLLYSWHWVTILSLEYSEDAKTAIATIMDEGMLKKIDLALWYATTKIGGGFVRFKQEAHESKQEINDWKQAQ